MRGSRTSPLVILGGCVTVLAISLIPFLRRDIGQRVMPNLFRSTAAALVVWFVYSFLSPPLPASPYFSSFVMLLGIFSLTHRISVWFRREPGAIHSFSTGRTRLMLPWGLAVTERYFEPLGAIVAGAAINHTDPLLSAWLIAAGASLFIDEQGTRLRGRTRVLDATDSRLEAAGLHSAVAARLAAQPPATASASLVRIAVPETSVTGPCNFRDQIDPALRRLIENDATKDAQSPL
jgi:hypothetical protein